KCYICATEFDTTEMLDSHLATHVGTSAQKCNLCDFPITTVRSLNMHLRTIHFRKGKRIPCEECRKDNKVREFSSNFKLQAHIKSYHEKIVEVQEKKHICTYCGKAFSRGTHLRMHENIHTKAILYNCKQCPFAATSRSGLLRHLRIHTAEKPFKCDECDASFNQSNALHSHKTAKHSDERPFACDICGNAKRFKTKYILQSHMKMHEKSDTDSITKGRQKNRHVEKHEKTKALPEKERLCNECGKTFQTSTAYHRHRQTHIDIVCKECGKSFSTSRTLRLHLLTVHLKSRPYKCDKCESSFGQLTSLNAHMKIHQK
ncbi:AAEL007896-PA, partial [Aedes aegypti]